MPTPPEFDERLVMLGVTVNATPSLATPDAITTKFPVVDPLGTATIMDVSLQLVIVVAAVPLNVTVLDP
jgi:hypothetical protein